MKFTKKIPVFKCWFHQNGVKIYAQGRNHDLCVFQFLSSSHECKICVGGHVKIMDWVWVEKNEHENWVYMAKSPSTFIQTYGYTLEKYDEIS